MGRPLVGHVRELGDGTFRARLRGVPLGKTKTREDAERLVEAAKQYERTHRHPRSVRVLGEAYLAKREREEQDRRTIEGAYTELKQIQPLWDRYVATSKFIDMHVENVRREHIVELVDSIVGRPVERYNRHTQTYVQTGGKVGIRTLKQVLSLLRQFFKQVPNLSSYGSPVNSIPIPNVQQQRERIDGDRIPHLHMDEIGRLFALPLDTLTPLHRTVYALGIYAGLRKGEIAAIRWMDIRFDEKEVRVRRSWRSFPKTQGSQREVPMLPQLERELRAYRKWLVEEVGSMPEHVQGMALLFPSSETQLVRSRSWDAGWKDCQLGKGRRPLPGIRTMSKVRKHIALKHMRHTFGTHMIKGSYFKSGKGIDVIVLATMMGHADVKMTMRHYMSRDVDMAHAAIREASARAIIKDDAEEAAE